MAHRIQVKTACIDDVEVHAFRETKTDRLRITGVKLDGQLAIPTISFWRAVFAEVGLASCVGPRFDEYLWFLRLRSAHPYLVFTYTELVDEYGIALLLGHPRDAIQSAIREELMKQQAESQIGDEIAEALECEQDDTMADRLSRYWDDIPPGFMDGPHRLRPSLN